MSDDREREISRPSLADAIDLLDLVRNSEDGARISTDAPAPVTESPVSPPPRSIPPPLPPVPAAKEEFVDVGDDAVDAPPSLPPIKVTSRASSPPPVTTPRKAKAVPEPPSSSSAMPPAVSIVLLLGLAIGGLYAILALPSDPAPPQKPAIAKSATPPPPPEPAELGTEPANLEVEGRPE